MKKIINIKWNYSAELKKSLQEKKKKLENIH